MKNNQKFTTRYRIINNPFTQLFLNRVLQIFMSLSKPNASTPSNTRIVSKFVNLTNMPMDGISFQVCYTPLPSDVNALNSSLITTTFCFGRDCYLYCLQHTPSLPSSYPFFPSPSPFPLHLFPSPPVNNPSGGCPEIFKAGDAVCEQCVHTGQL